MNTSDQRGKFICADCGYRLTAEQTVCEACRYIRENPNMSEDTKLHLRYPVS